MSHFFFLLAAYISKILNYKADISSNMSWDNQTSLHYINNSVWNMKKNYNESSKARRKQV
jgi:GT2 family glycosyltransferase